jgi:hypothetical protein
MIRVFVKGYAFSVVVVILTFLVSAISAALLADYIGIWKKPVIGSVAAFCVVISGYATAPHYKINTAIIWLIIGAISAWFLAGDSYYPEDYQSAYQLTIMPILATYLSGFFALLVCMVWHKKHKVYNQTLV